MPTEKEKKLTLKELRKLLNVCREAKEKVKEEWIHVPSDAIVEKLKNKKEARKDETD